MNPYTLNPPESDVVFEELCLEILKKHWSRPGLERFAKKGENQYGVDIFDTLGESPEYAAQCKLKEQWKSLEPGEIRAEVEKAKTFPSKLDHYAILTTGKISGEAQLTVKAINQEHRKAGLFKVELWTWEKISKLIRQYAEVEQQFYGGLRSEEVAIVTAKLDYIATLTESVSSASATSEIDREIDEARTHITPKDAQIAVMLLNRLQRTRGGDLSDWHRFRIFTNLGASSLMLGKGEAAARHFLDAAPLRPDDELAVANEVRATKPPRPWSAFPTPRAFARCGFSRHRRSGHTKSCSPRLPNTSEKTPRLRARSVGEPCWRANTSAASSTQRTQSPTSRSGRRLTCCSRRRTSREWSLRPKR